MGSWTQDGPVLQKAPNPHLLPPQNGPRQKGGRGAALTSISDATCAGLSGHRPAPELSGRPQQVLQRDSAPTLTAGANEAPQAAGPRDAPHFTPQVPGPWAARACAQTGRNVCGLLRRKGTQGEQMSETHGARGGEGARGFQALRWERPPPGTGSGSSPPAGQGCRRSS